MKRKLIRDDILNYLKDLAKEIKKEFGKNEKFELIVVGGASILLNYSFRDGTYDIDALKSGISSINTCIHKVADKNNLEDTWLNHDVLQTCSYSDKLREHSVYFGTFGNILKVYTVKDEYLISMKLVSFRDNDIEDIENIIQEMGDNYLFDKVDKAVRELYPDGWSRISDEAKEYINLI